MSGKWKGWGVSVPGPLHIKNSIPNQDAYVFKRFKYLTVGAVCDGLGSKPYSHIGSKGICEALVKTVKIFDFKKDLSYFNDILLSVWKMTISPVDYKDALSTVILVIIKDNKIYLANSGDGGAVILGTNSAVYGDEEEFSNITTPFGVSGLKWRVFNENDVNSIMLCTDGVYDDLQKNKIVRFAKEYIDYYKDVHPTKRYAQIRKMLSNWPVKGHSDDKTILTIYKE